jgi:hypothetical protein
MIGVNTIKVLFQLMFTNIRMSDQIMTFFEFIKIYSFILIGI